MALVDLIVADAAPAVAFKADPSKVRFASPARAFAPVTVQIVLFVLPVNTAFAAISVLIALANLSAVTASSAIFAVVT